MSNPPHTVMDDWSIEATLPKPEEIDALARIARPGMEVFLSTLPHVTLDNQLDTAERVRAAGLEPVPHIAARYVESRDAARAQIERLVGAADVNHVLLIAGDLGEPRGPLPSALAMLESGVFDGTPIRRIGIAGYPDGHPQIAADVLDQALGDKLRALAAAGIAAEIVGQFCFDARAIGAWIGRIREDWPDVPIRVGMAGPTSPRTLMRYAARCGVRASLSGIVQRLSMTLNLLKSVAPGSIVRHLNGHYDRLSPDGRLTAHFFSFGGLERTARWAAETAKQ